jgi:Kae1-associated kinase Bud32
VILIKGAEAVIKKGLLFGKKIVIKERIEKGYRQKELDLKLRAERTKNEARLLHKAKLAGINAPTVFEVEEFSISMSKIDGTRPKMDKEESQKAGFILAQLHSKNIIHGDYTPANLLKDKKGTMWVIDFGLGYISNDIEDKAVDVFTMIKTLENKREFLEGYRHSKQYEQIINRLKGIEKRVRYAF